MWTRTEWALTASQGHRIAEVWYDHTDAAGQGYVLTLVENNALYQERNVASEEEGQRLGEQWLAGAGPQTPGQGGE